MIKGVPGLLIALGIGIIGGFLNLMYLSAKGRELDMVHFIAVADGTKINVGDKFKESDFMKVSIPKNAVGNLDTVAVHWQDLNTLIGEPATKSYSQNEILLQKQIRTPPEMDIKKMLAADERVLWIPIDSRTFVAQLVNAGDNVSFLAPRMGEGFPTPADGTDGGAKGSASMEIIGPFRILALGNRLGSQEVQKASGISASQENVLAVAVKIANGEFEPKAQRVLDVLRMTNFQQVQIILHPSGDGAKGNK